MTQKYEIVTESGKVMAQFRLKATAVQEKPKMQNETYEKVRIRKIQTKW